MLSPTLLLKIKVCIFLIFCVYTFILVTNSHFHNQGICSQMRIIIEIITDLGGSIQQPLLQLFGMCREWINTHMWASKAMELTFGEQDILLFQTIKIIYSYWGASMVAQNQCGRPRSLIPGLGKSPREGNGNPLQYSCLENYMDKEAWWASIHGVTKSQKRLCDWHHLHICIHNEGLPRWC